MAGKVTKSAKVLPPKILPCTCAHEYQDKKFGKGLRFHNYSPKGSYTCTVCGKSK